MAATLLSKPLTTTTSSPPSETSYQSTNAQHAASAATSSASLCAPAAESPAAPDGQAARHRSRCSNRVATAAAREPTHHTSPDCEGENRRTEDHFQWTGGPTVGVLSVAKLRVGQEAYHLSGVAQSLDAYYTGAGEAAGVWVGGSAAQADLDGDVDPDDLRAVLAGMRPGTGGLTPNGDRPRPHPRRVPGFDLTFKAPKSASVLYAVSDDPRVQGAVVDAGEQAMRAAVGWLEEHTIRVRRGNHDAAWRAAHADDPDGPRELVTSGVVAAAFRHRTSRAGDPLLHWHVLVANIARGVDGRWSSIVHPHLYRQAKAAGEVFQAVFRDQLTASLGVEWRPGRHVPEIAGIPQMLIDGFSKRSQEIDDWLAATGAPDTPDGRQQAVLATRRRKPEVEHGRFDDDWKQEATAAGWGPDAAEALVAWYANRHPGDPEPSPWRLPTVVFDELGAASYVERIVAAEEWIADLLRTALTVDDSTFTLPDLHVAIAHRQGAGATVETIETIAHLVVASDLVIPVGDDDSRWTSRELVEVEDRFAAALHQRVVALPDTELPAGLAADQAAAVAAIARSDRAVTVLVGPAGTGKTYTVAAVAAVFEQQGFTVVGAAPSARAALELDAAGVPSRTLHRLLDDWRRRCDTPRPGSLLVIDEAAMADIRTLEAAVTTQLAAGGRVLLVGDHCQLPEIGAGGGFAYAADHAGTVATLTVNRRQHAAWERAALADLRDGSVATAVDTYLAHGRVHVTPDPAAMISAAVDYWFAARDTGHYAVLLAGTTATVDTLNQAIIARLVTAGELDDATVAFGRRSVRVGERVVLRRNGTETTVDGHPVTVANGQVGTVGAVADNRVTVALDAGVDVVLTGRYLARGGHIDHGWALTTHRAQGGTWDLAIAVGADGLYREGAYVQLSRGAHTNLVVLTDPEAAELHRTAGAELARHDSVLLPPGEQPADTRDDLIERIQRSRAKHLAHHHDPDLDRVDHLARTRTVPELDALHHAAVAAEHHATAMCGERGDELRALAERIGQVASRAAIGARVSPTDRHNVGVVTALDDDTGTVSVHFTSETGREATRRFSWDQLRLLDEPTPRPLPSHAARMVADLHGRAEQWTSVVLGFGVEPGDATRTARAIEQRITNDTHWLLAEPPGWLVSLLGDRPADVPGATTYDDTVYAIARWRARHVWNDKEPGLGPRPSHAAQEWDALTRQVAHARTWLATSPRMIPDPSFTPSRRELLDRLADLDAILDTAPPDWRPIIVQLRSGQLTLDDTDTLLAATDGQDARRRWILEHWPHVVEHHEVTAILAAGRCGPDPRLLDDLLHQPITDTLAGAIQTNQRWLRAALAAIVDRDDTTLDASAIELLEHLADDSDPLTVLGQLDRGSRVDVEDLVLEL
jgi:conjugative relaxase-like TrwC/TraI family protein